MDMFGNPIIAVEDTSFIDSKHIPLMLISDQTSPDLITFDFDLQNGIVILYFNEPIDYNSFSAVSITFTNALNSSAMHHLVGNNIRLTDSYNLDIQFSLDFSNIEALQANEYLATNNFTTYLTFTSTLVQDVYGNYVRPRIDGINSTRVNIYIRDSTKPNLLDFFQFDLNSASLVLSFSEPINVKSINITALTLTNGSTGGSSLTLTGGSGRHTDDIKKIVSISLAAEDIRDIKLNDNLATNVMNTYILFTNKFIIDMAGNDIIPQYSPVMVTQYLADITSPNLINYNLDMNIGQLLLTFDDVLRVNTLDAQYLELQNERFNPSANQLLSSASITSSPNGYIVNISLSFNDINSIKMLNNLATSKFDTYLAMRSETISDTAGVPVTAIVINDAQLVGNYTPDITRPQLGNFSLDVNGGLLILSFTEAINVITFDFTQISLQDNSNISTSDEVITLNGGYPNPHLTGVVILVTLTPSNLNSLKEMILLGTRLNNTFITLTANAVQDMANLNIIPILNSTALPAYSFKSDTIPPFLVNYCFSLNTGMILMTFSETVNAESVDPSRIFFQNQISPTSVYSLTGGEISTSNSIYISLNITPSDLNQIKVRPQLAISSASTFLGFFQGMVYDMNDNPILSINQGEAIRVNTSCYGERLNPILR